MVIGKEGTKIDNDAITVDFEEHIIEPTITEIVVTDTIEIETSVVEDLKEPVNLEEITDDSVIEDTIETDEIEEIIEEPIVEDIVEEKMEENIVYFNGKPYMEYFDSSMSIVERYSLELSIPEQFTEDDLRMLATMVFKENGTVKNEILVITDQYPDGVYMPADIMHEWTAQVCLNHIYDKRFPNTIYEDLAYPRYTTAYRSVELSEQCKREDPEQWERVVQSCLLAMNGYVDLPADVVCASNFPELGERYAAVYVDTGWFRSWSYFARA